MKISSIQIKNYRSISDAELSLQDMTVILGKNNEGKSNILMAVNVAISTLQIHAAIKRRRISYR
ncbi:MAG: AAA family ATPase, partial [Bacteroidales bacterium]|nr:AAA family ATPase [Bacteroidales bacterium]